MKKALLFVLAAHLRCYRIAGIAHDGSSSATHHIFTLHFIPEADPTVVEGP